MDWDLNSGRLPIRSLIFSRPQMSEYRCARVFTAPPNVSTYVGATRLYLYRFIYSRCPMILPYHHSPPRERDGVLVIIRLVGPRIHLTDPPTESKRAPFNPASIHPILPPSPYGGTFHSGPPNASHTMLGSVVSSQLEGILPGPIDGTH